jgi:F0F1-type ATP synthase membrane subunit b/b'
VEIHERLDELADAIESARSVPMSASCMVNRHEVLAAVDEIRRLLPADLTKADALLADADGVLERARQQGEEVIAAAHEEKMRLVSESEVQAQAEREAGRILAAAEAESQRMQREIDDYIDAKLANFEIVLTKTLEAVARGRDKIQGRRAVEELSHIDLPSLDEENEPDASASEGGDGSPGPRV